MNPHPLPHPRASRRHCQSLVDAAARIGVSTMTVRRLASSGHLAAYRIGPRPLRVDPDELGKMIATPRSALEPSHRPDSPTTDGVPTAR
jgi:excisionase family DNA binding protein